MKKVLIPLVLAFCAQHAFAAPLYFDPFADATANGGTSYTAGSALASQQNNSANIWNPVNTIAGPQPTIVANSLSYPNLPQSSGNSISFSPATLVNQGQGVRLNFNASIPTNAAYFSYILKITDLSRVSTSATTNFFAGWSDGNTA